MIDLKSYSKKWLKLNWPSVLTDNNPKFKYNQLGKNNRIVFQENQIFELEHLKKTDIKQIIMFLYNIQFPIRLIHKLIRNFNFFKAIKSYEVFNKKKNMTYNIMTPGGVIEPSSREILNTKLTSFIHDTEKIIRSKKYYSNIFNKHSGMNSEFIHNLNVNNKSMSNLNSNQGINLNPKIGVIKFFLESLSKFNANMVYNQFTLYNYNKSIKFDSLEQACESIKFKYLGVSGVYILRSMEDSERFYIGSSNNLARRMEEYNKLTKGLRNPHSASELEISKNSALN